MAEFSTVLWRYPGKGGWVFAIIPKKHAPPVTHPWGRTPVRAAINGHEWTTSVFRDSKNDRSLLPVPKAIRGELKDGGRVMLSLAVLSGED